MAQFRGTLSRVVGPGAAGKIGLIGALENLLKIFVKPVTDKKITIDLRHSMKRLQWMYDTR